MWPWSTIMRLETQLRHAKTLELYLKERAAFMENLALKALREQAAAHKGIRRLRAKLDRALVRGRKEQQS